jgi:DnaJ family protein C protein 1
MMGINQDATLSEIKRAFRNLSVILHPDKNDAEDANVVFRNLVSVYEVLKDPAKREKYDNVLKNGLPNWKSAVYYYRKARKMGLAESSILLFILITIGQYVVAWGVYIEKKYTMVSFNELNFSNIQNFKYFRKPSLTQKPRNSGRLMSMLIRF